ncbi:hypothetical protein L4D19_29930 [Photobacterium kasasachensis]
MGKPAFGSGRNRVAQERENLGHSFIVGLSLKFWEMQVAPFFAAPNAGN